MTKRILSVLAMMSIAAMMMLSSCSDIGTETGTETGTNTDCSLIGKWEYSRDGFTQIVEITADDKLIVIDGAEGDRIECTIKSIDDHEITYEYNNQEVKVAYSDLSRDTVKFGDNEYKKVDDIGTETGTNTDFSLIGKWEHSENGLTQIVEITDDDKLIIINKSEGYRIECTIKSIDDHEITYEYNNQEVKVAYSDLSRDTVKIGSGENKKEYKKVY